METAVRTVLVLHGYSQNGNIFRKRLGALRKQCGKDVEFVFVDGPHILEPADLFGSSPQNTITLEALGASEASNGSVDPALIPRAWWKSNAERTKAIGLDASLIVLRDVLKERRFDGVFGFSQGAAMAALLAALLERPHLHPPFLIDGKTPHPPFQFCVAISGFKLIDPIATSIFTPSYSTPTLHVLGKTDVVVSEERSRLLIDVSGNKRVEEHDGGHNVPSKSNWRKFLSEYLRDPLGEVFSPSQASSSTPNSGAATPTGWNSGAVATMKL